MARTVHVLAASRLHFGMFSFGTLGVRQFGGVGAMIDRPGLELYIHPAAKNDSSGPHAERALAFALRFLRHAEIEEAAGFHLEITSAPPQHVGLGTGTQLAMSVSAGLNRFFGRSQPSAAELAAMVGRGRRSSIGLYGFAQGGLLVDPGKRHPREIPRYLARLELPSAWRFVLLRPRRFEGLSGAAEQNAFAELPPVPPATTDALCREVVLNLLPAAAEADFTGFSKSLYRFGLTAGRCFAHRQGGAFASEELAGIVAEIRRLGVDGVGQSSWGPTIFVLTATQREAESLVEDVRSRGLVEDADVRISSPQNCGAEIAPAAKKGDILLL